MIRALTGPLAGRDDLSDTDLEEGYGVDPPAVRANFVLSLDGVVALDGVSGGLAGPADKEVFDTLRALCDVVVVGAGTLRAEGYGPAFLGADRRARRSERGQSPLPSIAVVSARADLDPASRLFTERRDEQPEPPRPYVFTTAAAPPARVAALAAVAHVVTLGAERVELAAMAAHLAGNGMRRALCEGGPALLVQMVGAGLVDDLCLTYSPMLAGPGHKVLAGGADGPAFASPARFRLRQLLEGDGLLLTRYGRVSTP